MDCTALVWLGKACEGWFKQVALNWFGGFQLPLLQGRNSLGHCRHCDLAAFSASSLVLPKGVASAVIFGHNDHALIPGNPECQADLPLLLQCSNQMVGIVKAFRFLWYLALGEMTGVSDSTSGSVSSGDQPIDLIRPGSSYPSC